MLLLSLRVLYYAGLRPLLQVRYKLGRLYSSPATIVYTAVQLSHPSDWQQLT
jgi:hypothetical protein